MLGFDSEGRGLWDDSSYFEGDLSSAYEDVYQERIDLQYLEFLRRASLPYYGTSVGPHDPVPHRDAYKAWSLATYPSTSPSSGTRSSATTTERSE